MPQLCKYSLNVHTKPAYRKQFLSVELQTPKQTGLKLLDHLWLHEQYCTKVCSYLINGERDKH